MTTFERTPRDAPSVNPRKWTTKVNIAMLIAVLVVLGIGIWAAVHALRNPADVREDVHENVSPPN